MRILVAGDGSRVIGLDDMAAAMQPHGHQLIATSKASGELRGSALLLLGFENWYLDAPIELLDRAAAAGHLAEQARAGDRRPPRTSRSFDVSRQQANAC